MFKFLLEYYIFIIKEKKIEINEDVIEEII